MRISVVLTLIRMAVKKYVAVRLGVIYGSPGNQSERGRLDVMLRSYLEAPCLHLKRAGDREGSSEAAWCTDYWQGERPGGGWRWRELKVANKPLGWPKYTKTEPKMGGFSHFLA
jgi:hypothetical protein